MSFNSEERDTQRKLDQQEDEESQNGSNISSPEEGDAVGLASTRALERSVDEVDYIADRRGRLTTLAKRASHSHTSLVGAVKKHFRQELKLFKEERKKNDSFKCTQNRFNDYS